MSAFARSTFGAALFSGLVLMSLPAMATQPVVVGADRAKIIDISGDPATVIVGNPLFADASIQRGKVIILGRHFGATNVIVLNRDGQPLAEFEVSVTRGGSQNVVLYKAGKTWSYSCAPNCEYHLTVGDEAAHFSDTIQKEMDSKGAASVNAATAGTQ